MDEADGGDDHLDAPMTNAVLLDSLGRLLAEAVASEWDATVRQALINTAYAIAQARWREVNPAAFLAGATAHVVANQRAYQLPNFENIDRFEWLRNDGSGIYDELPMLMRSQAQAIHGQPGYTNGPTRCSYAYYVEGQEMIVVPTPTVSVTNGLGVVYVEVVEMNAPGDIPRLPVVLHHLLPFGAAVLGIEDSKDAADSIVDRWRARWASLFGSFEASTPESRKALRLLCRQNQSLPMVGANMRSM